MKIAAGAIDGRIDLHRVYRVCAVAERGGHVVTRPGADNEHAIRSWAEAVRKAEVAWPD